MRLLSSKNKVYKNYQINLGMPFQVKIPTDETFEGHFSNLRTDGDFGDGSDGGDREGYAVWYEAGDGDEYGDRGGTGSGVGYDDDGTETEEYKDEGDNSEEDGEPDIDPEEKAARAAEQIIIEAEERCASMVMDAEEKAKAVLDDAKIQGKLIVEASKKESTEFAKRTEEESRKKGYKDGFAEGKAQYEMRVMEAQQIKEQAELDYKELLGGAEADAVTLVIDIAKKVIGDELELNPQNILLLIKDALDRCSNKENVTLKVSPDDFDFIRANKDVLLSMVDGVGELEVKMDMAMQQNSCLVETPLGHVNAGVATKLGKIEDAFYKVITS